MFIKMVVVARFLETTNGTKYKCDRWKEGGNNTEKWMHENYFKTFWKEIHLNNNTDGFHKKGSVVDLR